VKKQLLLGAAVSVLAAIDPAMAQTPAWNWTGFYAGLNVGYSWGNGAVTYNEPVFAARTSLPGTFSGPSFLDGAIGGFQIGYNWQIQSTWVIGLEADWQAASEVANGSFSNSGICDGEGPCRISGSLGSQILWFGTVRGRVGWLYTPQVMVYATGGLAYGKVDDSGNFSLTTAGLNCLSSCVWGFHQSAINTGWTVGGGIEGVVANMPTVTWKVEYLYVDLGSIGGSGFDTLPLGDGGLGGPNPFTFNAHFTDNIFRVGLNWQFSH